MRPESMAPQDVRNVSVAARQCPHAVVAERFRVKYSLPPNSDAGVGRTNATCKFPGESLASFATFQHEPC